MSDHPDRPPHPGELPAWPAAWTRSASELAGPVALSVAGFPLQVEITRPLLDRVLFPLLTMLLQRANGEQRVLAGLAGIPGGGKSTFAAILQNVAERTLGAGVLMVVGMDGWHWANAVLDARTTTDADGRTIPLRHRKGGPESYDVASLATALGRLRDASGDVPLPAYDRRVHEPAADALVIPRTARIVLIEGNYVLCDEMTWKSVCDLLSPRLFLASDPAAVRERIIARHVRGGASPDEARLKYNRNDRLNIEYVLGGSKRIEWLIQLEPEPLLRTD